VSKKVLALKRTRAWECLGRAANGSRSIEQLALRQLKENKGGRGLEAMKLSRLGGERSRLARPRIPSLLLARLSGCQTVCGSWRVHLRGAARLKALNKTEKKKSKRQERDANKQRPHKPIGHCRDRIHADATSSPWGEGL